MPEEAEEATLRQRRSGAQQDEAQKPPLPKRKSSFFTDEEIAGWRRVMEGALPKYLVAGPYTLLVKLELVVIYVALLLWAVSLAIQYYRSLSDRSVGIIDPYFGSSAPLFWDPDAVRIVYSVPHAKSRLLATSAVLPQQLQDMAAAFIDSVGLQDSALLCALCAWRFLCALYGLYVERRVFKEGSGWAVLSYTLNSWNLAIALNALRLCLGLLDLAHRLGIASDPASSSLWMFFAFAAEILRYPSLVTTIVTFSIWWGVLAPIFAVGGAVRDGFKGFVAAVSFNFHFTMFSVHVLNVPIALVESLLFPRQLAVSDLFVGCCHLLGYVIIYLKCLDANYVHIYIPLNPRTNFSIFVHFLLIWLYGKTWIHFSSS